MNQDKLNAMLFGVFLGDALGSPVEGMTAQQITEKHGRVRTLPARIRTTDDWQLTQAVAEALIAFGLDMNAQAAAHVAAMKESIKGWGGTTKEAVSKVARGTHWSRSGLVGGLGNGVAMKVAPLAAVYASLCYGHRRLKLLDFAVKLTQMTHHNRLAVAATLAQIAAIEYCLVAKASSFAANRFIQVVSAHSALAEVMAPPDPFLLDNLTARLLSLNTAKVGDFAGNGYVYNSLPFVYTHFLRNPRSVETLFNAVNAGGDTDTNAAMVGALLGALNGMEIFPPLLEQVPRRKLLKVVDLAERFAASIGMKEASR